MKTAKLEIREPEKLEVILTLRADIKDFRFIKENPQRCPGNEWFYQAIDELLDRADKQIFVTPSSD